MTAESIPNFDLIARRDLVAALNALRYGASVSRLVPRVIEEDTEAQFLADITDWIVEFNRVLATVSDTTTNMAAELTELRSQRKAVRDFLGLTNTERKTP